MLEVRCSQKQSSQGSQPKQEKPWYCGAGNSRRTPSLPPTDKQWAVYAAGDAAIAAGIARYTKGKIDSLALGSHEMQSTKVLYGCHVIVFLTWLYVMRRIIDRWNLMSPDMHFDLCIFMVFFCLLWLNTFRDKNAYINLAAINGILLAGYRLASLHM